MKKAVGQTPAAFLVVFHISDNPDDSSEVYSDVNVITLMKVVMGLRCTRPVQLPFGNGSCVFLCIVDALRSAGFCAQEGCRALERKV